MGESPKLPARLAARVRIIAGQLREVDPKSESEWLEGFALDWRPEREIAIWEVMALAYTSFVDEHDLSQKAKEDALGLALSKSFGRTDAEIRGKPTSALNEQERRDFLRHFTAAAKTLGMLDTFA